MIDILKNDKLWVIACVTAIAIICVFRIPEKADTIILAIISGMFGVAVGQRIRATDTPTNNVQPTPIPPPTEKGGTL